MRVIMAVVVTVMALKLTPVLVVEAQQFSLVHRYAQLAGSPANSRGQGASPEYAAMLSAHDRRRLAVIDFPLGGNYLPVGYASNQGSRCLVIITSFPKKINFVEKSLLKFKNAFCGKKV